jgi:hypothetical protein
MAPNPIKTETEIFILRLICRLHTTNIGRIANRKSEAATIALWAYPTPVIISGFRQDPGRSGCHYEPKRVSQNWQELSIKRIWLGTVLTKCDTGLHWTMEAKKMTIE